HHDLPSFPTRRSSDLSVALVGVVTAEVGMLNDTDELPPGTVTDGGGLSAPELLLKATDTPLPGAAPCSCTMPEVGTPPVIGLKRSEEHTSELQSRENL